MTTEEIKTLIDQKIAGQGTMVDVGGALPTILKEIVDAVAANKEAIADIPTPQPVSLEINTSGFTDKTKEEAAAILGITTSEFDQLHGGYIPLVRIKGASFSYLVTVDNDGDVVRMGQITSEGEFYINYSLSVSGGKWYFSEV